MRLLDVGCGWASLLVHAAEHYGVRATGVTLSAQQQAYGLARVEALGLADQVEIRLQDYRELTDEPFDAVASIEMGEHVGEHDYRSTPPGCTPCCSRTAGSCCSRCREGQPG